MTAPAYALSYQERMETDPLFRDFIQAIRNYRVSNEIIRDIGFYYAGGDFKEHDNYWNMRYGGKQKPEHQAKCVCNVDIKHNCYITDDDEFFLVIGRCCIKRFVPKEKQGRTCSNCKTPHRNKKDNLCGECRKRFFVCGECKKPTSLIYPRPHKAGIICNTCDDKVKT